MAADDTSQLPASRSWRDLGLAAGGESGRGNPSKAASARARALRFEPEDMDARVMAWLTGGLAVCVAISVGAMFVMLNIFNKQNTAGRPQLTIEQTTRIVPPRPHLQADPVADLHALRAHAAHILQSYGWLDPAHSHARIPIARAMTLTVGQSLDGPEE